jgi:hypothetical protein
MNNASEAGFAYHSGAPKIASGVFTYHSGASKIASVFFTYHSGALNIASVFLVGLVLLILLFSV